MILFIFYLWRNSLWCEYKPIYFIPLSSTIHLFSTLQHTLPAPLEIDMLVHDKQKGATCLPLHNPVGMSLGIPSYGCDRIKLQDSSAALLQMMS